jgi:hypothetical protein
VRIVKVSLDEIVCVIASIPITILGVIKRSLPKFTGSFSDLVNSCS